MHALLISNSTMAGEPFLQYSKPEIGRFLQGKNNVVFVPYANVSMSYDDYETKINECLTTVNVQVKSIHRFADPKAAVASADAIMVSGGNTWFLTHELNRLGLMQVIRQAVQNGAYYVGWSAGAVIASPTMQTTNDMPIIDPQGMLSLALVPFQINPHYTDGVIPNHGGETRAVRISEFVSVNQNATVVGLPEGCMFLRNGLELKYIGNRSAKIFKYGKDAEEIPAKSNFNFLLNL